MISFLGGEGGIRTHVRAFGPQVDFESTPLRPLRYLSGKTSLATELTEGTEKIVWLKIFFFISILCGLWALGGEYFFSVVPGRSGARPPGIPSGERPQ